MGDSDQSVPYFAANVICARVDRLVYEMERARRSPGAGVVHALRVATRRLAAALDTFESCTPAGARARLIRGLKRIRATAGGVRDRDIALGLLWELGVDAPTALNRRLVEERTAGARRLRAALAALLDRGPALRWRKSLRLPPATQPAACCAETAGDRARATLPDMARSFFLEGRCCADPKAPIERVHAFRIQGKKFRYSVEVFLPCYGSEMEEGLYGLKTVQDSLGSINDCEAVERLLLASSKTSGTAPARAAIELRKQELRMNFEKDWRRTFDVAGELEVWLLTLGRTVG